MTRPTLTHRSDGWWIVRWGMYAWMFFTRSTARKHAKALREWELKEKQ